MGKMKHVLVITGRASEFRVFISEKIEEGNCTISKNSLFKAEINNVRYLNIPIDNFFHLVRCIKDFDVVFYGTYYCREDWHSLIAHLNSGLHRQGKELVNPGLRDTIRRLLDIPDAVPYGKSVWKRM
jgi:hypothetical protein